MKKNEQLFENDIFAKKLGIEFLSLTDKKCSLKLNITKSMTNGLGFVHNSISYVLAETAFYILANSSGKLSLTLETTMSYPLPIIVGDSLIANADIIESRDKTKLIDVIVKNQKEKVVGLFRGTIFITNKDIG